MLGKSPRSKGDIQVKLNLTTQAVLYTKTNGPCTAVTRALTINTTVLFIDQQAHQGGVMPYNNLGNISGIFHGNNQNNRLERRAQPPRNVP